MARALIDIVGDSASAQRAIEQTSVAVAGLGDELQGLAVDAKASAEAMIAASSQRIARLQAEAAAAKELSGSYAFGSAEQIAAANLYEQRITRISRMQGTLGATAGEAAQLQVSATMRQVAALDAEAAAYGRIAEASSGAAAKIASTNAAQAAANRDRLLGVGAAAAEPSITRTAGTVGRGLTTFATVPAAFIGYEAIKQAIDFNQQMLLIRTQAGDATDSIKGLSQQVLELAKVSPQGPAELAQGLYHLVSLGLRGDVAMRTLRTSSLAAGMGIADLESTATALGAVVVTGIQGAQNYDHAMGLLVGTVGSGNVRMEDLAASIGNVAPAAAAAGVDLTSLGAAIATMTDRGFSAEEASTRLRIALSLIQSPSEKAKKALADMGVDADTLGATLRQPNGLLKVLETLHAAVDRVGKVRGNRDLLAGFGGGRSGLGIQTLVQSLDSSVSSYKQKLEQVDQQSKRFAENQRLYMQSPAYQLHTALSTVEADLVKLGQSLTPVATGFAHAVSGIADAFTALPGPVKESIGIIVGILAVAGPLGLAIKGVGVLAGGIGAAVTGLAGMFRRVPEEAGPSIAATEAELRSLQAQLVATNGEVVGLGASFERLPLTAGPAIAATEAETAGLGGAGLLGRLGPAALFAGGGLLAGQVAGSAIPGRAGSIIGGGLEGAGIGAGIGMLGGPFAPISVPVGAAAGAGLGALVAGITSLIHSGPSFTEQMRQMSTSVQGLGTAAGTAGRELAQLRLSRDQLQQQIKADRAAVAQSPNSRIARDQLLADLAQLQGIDQQLAAWDAKRAKALKTQRDTVAEIVSKTQDLGTVTVQANRAGISAWRVGGQLVEGAKNKLQAYENKLLQLADSAQASDPRLADVYYKLHDIAVETGKIPGHKKVEIVVNAEYSKNAKQLLNLFGLAKIGVNLDAAFSGLFKGLKPSDVGGPKSGPQPIYAFQLPQALQLEQAKASAGYMSQKKADEDVKQYILAHLKQYRGQALIDAYNELASVGAKNTASANKAAAAARKAQTAFDHKVTEDQLLARARLDLADGEVGAARVLLRRDQERLQAMLAEASTNDERVTVLRQLTEVKRMLHSKADAFALSPKLQEEMARAGAIAALDPGLSGPTALQIRLAKQAKAAAMRAIHSHQLTMQGLTQAWEIVAQENAILAQTKSGIDTYHAVATSTITKGLGLTHDTTMAIRERLAQAEAHRGYAPNGPAADGHVIGMGAGGTTLTIDGGIHLHGVHDVRKLIAELEKYLRQTHQRAGGRR